MKYFFVISEASVPLYSDHPRGEMACLPMGTFQELFLENHNQLLRAMRVGNAQFVFDKFDFRYFMVVSSDDEPVEILRRLLGLFRDLMQFRWGPASEADRMLNEASQGELKPYIDKAIFLAETRQSFLVQAVEFLKVNDEIRQRCQEALQLAMEDFEESSHALLFVGSKLVCMFSKSDATSLSMHDLFLLSLHAEVTFDDQIVHREFDEEDSSSRSPSNAEDELSIFHEVLFLYSPNVRPCGVFTCLVEDTARLLLITRPDIDPVEVESEVVFFQEEAQDRLRDDIDFLLVKESTHMTMISYLHECPGLVHFIYIDRSSNEVIAPNFCPLHGKESIQTPENALASEDFVRNEVWTMFYSLQPIISQGCTEVILKRKEFQYSYRLWFEGPDGEELDSPETFDTSLLLQCGGHNELTRSLFGNRRASCYELYALYIGLVPDEYILQQNRKLITKLRSEE